MLPLPWIKGPAASSQDDVLIMVSRLELKSLTQVLPFLLSSLRILRQASRSDGAVGFAIAAQPLSRTFWTQSAWVDRKSLQAFNAADPHGRIVANFRPHMLGSTFTFFTAPRSQSQGSWSGVRARLAEVEAAKATTQDR